MNWERSVRYVALGAMLLVPLAVWWTARSVSDGDVSETEPASDSVSQDLLPALPDGQDASGVVGEGPRGKAASTSLPVQPAPQRKASKAQRQDAPISARDLPLAETPSALTPAGAGRPSGPCGGIQVRGITHSPDPDWAFSMLAEGEGERARMRRQGDRIGNYRVQRIEWDRVALVGGGGTCVVRLSPGVREAAEARGDAIPADEGQPEPPVWLLTAELREAIAVTEDGVVIERGVVPALADRALDLFSGMELVPRREQEVTKGVIVQGVSEESLLHHLGFRSGDALLSIDGATFAGPEDFASAIRRLETGVSFSLRGVKAGREVELRVSV